jgi:hypothetical protein
MRLMLRAASLLRHDYFFFGTLLRSTTVVLGWVFAYLIGTNSPVFALRA